MIKNTPNLTPLHKSEFDNIDLCGQKQEFVFSGKFKDMDSFIRAIRKSVDLCCCTLELSEAQQNIHTFIRSFLAWVWSEKDMENFLRMSFEIADKHRNKEILQSYIDALAKEKTEVFAPSHPERNTILLNHAQKLIDERKVRQKQSLIIHTNIPQTRKGVLTRIRNIFR